MRRLELVRDGEQLRAELSGELDPVVRSEEEKRMSLSDLAEALTDTSEIQGTPTTMPAGCAGSAAGRAAGLPRRPLVAELSATNHSNRVRPA